MKIRYEKAEIRLGDYVANDPCCRPMELYLRSPETAPIVFDSTSLTLQIIEKGSRKTLKGQIKRTIDHCPFCGEKIIFTHPE